MEKFDQKIAELEQGLLVIDLYDPDAKRCLEEQGEKYLNLLPPQYRKRYQASQDTKLQQSQK